MKKKSSCTFRKSKNSNIFYFISNGLVKIHQELFRLHRTDNIFSVHNGDLDRLLVVIKKKFSFIDAKFDMESVYGQYSIERLDIHLN
jgi:hypothetical protein